MKVLDRFLNSITMYRLLLNGLAVIWAIALVFAFAGRLQFGGLELIVSSVVLGLVCYGSNYLLARLYQAPRNIESALITAQILTFILPPSLTLKGLATLALAGLIAIASKYVLAFRNKHLFNPAAFGALSIGLIGLVQASWWIGSTVLLPFVLVFGLMVVRKIRRSELFLSFLVVSLGILLYLQVPLVEIFVSWPLIFFATSMLTEPLTTPPTTRLQVMYGALVAILFASRWHVGPVYATPESALILGNIFSYIVSPKQKLILQLKDKVEMAPRIYDFIFAASEKLKFKAGQYIEWTLPHGHADDRGNRRFFTVASSPTEDMVHLGVKMYEPASSFKNALLHLEKGAVIAVGQLAGDFTLPENKDEKLVFIAGGIGITPFRSMSKYLADIGEKRDVVLFYAIADPSEVVYREILEKSLRVVYVLRSEIIPTDWKGETGVITQEMLEKIVPDYKGRIFYISGPNIVVDIYRSLLRKLGVRRSKIITDYFPGY